MDKRSKWWLIIGGSILGICLLACLGVGLLIRFWPDVYQYSLDQGSLKVGTPAPDFELASLDGPSVRLSQFKGQPVLLSFGASWCPDCRAEAPLLQELHENHPDLTILLIDSQESPAAVRDFASEFGMTHPVLLDTDGSVSDRYQIVAIPTELFIDADGIIRAKLIETVTPEVLAEKLPLIGVNP